MIIGVTHDQDGRVIQRLSVSTKVSIGLPPNGDCNHPTKLDHFVFLRKKKSANRVGWEVDPELTEHYGEECREVHIILIDDDIENVFPSSYAWWTATERKCWGDGASATRRTAEKPGGQTRVRTMPINGRRVVRVRTTRPNPTDAPPRTRPSMGGWALNDMVFWQEFALRNRGTSEK